MLRKSVLFDSPKRDLSSAYTNKSVLCMTSRWQGFPNIVAESLSNGLLVVGFALCSGIPEFVEEGFTGTIAEGMNDPVALADALLKASKNSFSTDDIKEALKNIFFRTS